MLRRNRDDLLIVLALGFAAAVAAYVIPRTQDRSAWQDNDFWFDLDTHRVGLQMVGRNFSPLNTNLHPGFVLFTNPPLSLLTPLSETNQLVLYVCSMSAIWVGGFFVTLRMIGLRRLDAVLFTGIAGASAASLFLSPMPESYVAAIVSTVLVVGLVAWDRKGEAHPALYVAAALIAIGVSLIGGVVATVAIVTRYWGRWKSAVGVLAIVALGIVAMSGVQHVAFPDTQFILDRSSQSSSDTDDVISEAVFADEAGGPLRVAGSFVFHSIVAPDVDTRTKEPTGETILGFQDSTPGSGTALGVVSVVGWAALLGFGVYALARLQVGTRNLRVVLGASTVALLLFLLVFGQDTFLFSPFFMPLLVGIAALGSLTSHRTVVLSLAVVVLVSALVNNLIQLDRANDLLELVRSASALVHG